MFQSWFHSASPVTCLSPFIHWYSDSDFIKNTSRVWSDSEISCTYNTSKACIYFICNIFSRDKMSSRKKKVRPSSASGLIQSANIPHILDELRPNTVVGSAKGSRSAVALGFEPTYITAHRDGTGKFALDLSCLFTFLLPGRENDVITNRWSMPCCFT